MKHFTLEDNAQGISIEFEPGDSSVGLVDAFGISDGLDGYLFVNPEQLRALHRLIGQALERYDEPERAMSGWIEYREREVPVAPDVRVDVRFHNGEEAFGDPAETWAWGVNDNPVDYNIVAYRLHQPNVYAQFADVTVVTE